MKIYSLGHRPLAIMALMIVLLSGQIATTVPYLSVLATEYFGLSLLGFSAVMAVSAILGLVAALIAGLRSDATGKRRWWALVLSGLGAAGGLLISLYQSPIAFVLTHAVIWPVAGALIGLVFAQARALVEDWEQAPRDAAMGEIRALFSLPFAVVPLVWSFMFAWGISPISVYPVALVILGLNLALVLTSWPKDQSQPVTDDRPAVFAGAKILLTSKVGIPVASLTMISIGPSIFLAYLGLLFVELPNRDISQVGMLSGLVAAVEIPCMILVPRLLARLSKGHQLCLGAGIYAAFLAVIFPASMSWHIWALIPAIGFSAAIILSVVIGYLQDLLRKQPGTASFLISLVNIGASLLCAGILALGASALSLQGVSELAAVWVFLGGLVLFFYEAQTGGQVDLA